MFGRFGASHYSFPDVKSLTMDIEEQVNRALDELGESVRVEGPVVTDNHTNYFVTGLAETRQQLTNLSWCLAGFMGAVFRVDLSIDSAIGTGHVASNNLLTTMEKRLKISKSLTLRQRERNRDPLLQELIAHTLVLIHQRKAKVAEWLGTICACRRPHPNPNDSGIDLIALGSDDNGPFPVIGEVKAYEKNPVGGLTEACIKFTEVRNGEHNDEIRSAFQDIDRNGYFSKEELANNIWTTGSKFGALVGHDNHRDYAIKIGMVCNAEEVAAQPGDRLFFICTPFEGMRTFFSTLTKEVVQRASELGQ